MTLQEWLQKAEGLLRTGPHPDRARRDAELLLRHVLRYERAALIARRDEQLDDLSSSRYGALLERRKSGEPIQYIFGETEFYGLPFRVTRDVLIPRSETEHLVEKVLELASKFKQPRVVDVGTGSGAIAVAVAHSISDATVTAIDLSSAALAVAAANAKLNVVDERIRFLRGDLLQPISASGPSDTSSAENRFEIVVSNPPYVPTRDESSLAVEVRQYEPRMALFAGDDGLDVYRRLIPQAFDVLVSGGYVALEIGYGQAGAVRTLLHESGFEQSEFTLDLQSIDRVASAMRP
jgi:release factor glutamine methyltransferase